MPSSFSVFLSLARRRRAFGTSTDTAASLTVFLFLFFRRSAFGTSTDIGASLTVFLFFCFWHVEGALLARRRTLGPALQFFCFLFFSRSKEQFWHVDGHWDQPYSFSVFLFLARRRGAFGTSTDIGTSLTVFLFSVFRRSTVGTSTDIGTSLTVFLFFCFWHVDGALLARRRTLGLALQFF